MSKFKDKFIPKVESWAIAPLLITLYGNAAFMYFFNIVFIWMESYQVTKALRSILIDTSIADSVGWVLFFSLMTASMMGIAYPKLVGYKKTKPKLKDKIDWMIKLCQGAMFFIHGLNITVAATALMMNGINVDTIVIFFSVLIPVIIGVVIDFFVSLTGLIYEEDSPIEPKVVTQEPKKEKEGDDMGKQKTAEV